MLVTTVRDCECVVSEGASVVRAEDSDSVDDSVDVSLDVSEVCDEVCESEVLEDELVVGLEELEVLAAVDDESPVDDGLLDDWLSEEEAVPEPV